MTYIRTTNPKINHAIDVILDTYGDSVSVDEKKKDLLKYGRNQNVGNSSAGYTIWFTGQDDAHETYVFKNLIDSISSGNTSDVMKLVIEGHTVGTDLSVSSLTQSSGTATCTTSGDHNLTTGDWVYIAGANEPEYNGIVEITVTGATTFTFSVDAAATSPATGTITATDQSKTFVSQEKTLSGRTRVVLDTALARMTRIAIAEQDRATDSIGEIYGYENTSLTLGKPTNTSKIHVTVPSFKNQSQKASTTLSSQDYWIVTGFRGSVLEKASAFADIELQIRKPGGVFRAVEDVTATSQNAGVMVFDPYIIVPKNSDVRLVAVSDSTSRDISGSIQGYLAKIQS